MDVLGNEILAHPGLAEQQHGGVGGGNVLYHGHQLQHPRTLWLGERQVGAAPFAEDGFLVGLDQLTLQAELLFKSAERRGIPGKGDDKRHIVVIVKHRVPLQHHPPASLGQLHQALGLARLDDIGIEDLVELAVPPQIGDPLADHFLMIQAGNGFIGPIDMEGYSFLIGDIDTLIENIEDFYRIFAYLVHTMHTLPIISPRSGIPFPTALDITSPLWPHIAAYHPSNLVASRESRKFSLLLPILTPCIPRSHG